MSDVATMTRKPVIPPREPTDEADWRVTVRHCPLPPTVPVRVSGVSENVKQRVVRAKGKRAAWEKFLNEISEILTPDSFGRRNVTEAQRLHYEAHEWIKAARREMPEGVEIIGAEYAKARINAMRVKGTITVDQIGFPELASA